MDDSYNKEIINQNRGKGSKLYSFSHFNMNVNVKLEVVRSFGNGQKPCLDIKNIFITMTVFQVNSVFLLCFRFLLSNTLNMLVFYQVTRFT